MTWSEYKNEHYEQVPMDEEETEPPPCEPLEFQDWVDWYEPHLSNMWTDFVAYRSSARIHRDVANTMDFWDFARVMYNFSHKMATPIM